MAKDGSRAPKIAPEHFEDALRGIQVRFRFEIREISKKKKHTHTFKKTKGILRFLGRHGRLKRAQDAPKVAPSRARWRTGRLPRWPKFVPRGFEDACRCIQARFRFENREIRKTLKNKRNFNVFGLSRRLSRAQDAPKMRQDGAKTGQDGATSGPEMAQDGSRALWRCLKMYP